jgi:hypothetical protein
MNIFKYIDNKLITCVYIYIYTCLYMEGISNGFAMVRMVHLAG